MTDPCQARSHSFDTPCGKVHRPGSAVGERHARMVKWRAEEEERYRRKVGTVADWCGHSMGVIYRFGGVIDTWPCERCGLGCQGTRQDDGDGARRIGCCRGEECR